MNLVLNKKLDAAMKNLQISKNEILWLKYINKLCLEFQLTVIYSWYIYMYARYLTKVQLYVYCPSLIREVQVNDWE